MNLIEKARQRINSYVKRTALVYSRTLSELLGTNVCLKLELFKKNRFFQRARSF